MVHLKIEERKRFLKVGDAKSKVFYFSKLELADLFRYFYFMISSGINLAKGINVLKKILKNKKLNLFLDYIFQEVALGNNLSDSMKSMVYVPSFVVNLIKIGEEAGKLDKIFQELSNYFECEYKFEKELKGSLCYPVFLIITSLIAFFIMSKQVIPKFYMLLQEFNIKELPYLTKFVILFSKCIFVFLCMLVTAFLVLFFLTKIKHKKINKIAEKVLMNIPIYSEVKKKLEIARFARSLALILESGGTVLDALDLSITVIDTTIIHDAISESIENIKLGKSIAEAFSKNKVIPSYFLDFISVGEETGELESSLNRISTFLEEEVLRRIKLSISMITPVLIIIISLHVGLLIISIMVPMLELFNNIKI